MDHRPWQIRRVCQALRGVRPRETPAYREKNVQDRGINLLIIDQSERLVHVRGGTNHNRAELGKLFTGFFCQQKFVLDDEYPLSGKEFTGGEAGFQWLTLPS
jgi:hypothetical protein